MQLLPSAGRFALRALVRTWCRGVQAFRVQMGTDGIDLQVVLRLLQGAGTTSLVIDHELCGLQSLDMGSDSGEAAQCRFCQGGACVWRKESASTGRRAMPHITRHACHLARLSSPCRRKCMGPIEHVFAANERSRQMRS